MKKANISLAYDTERKLSRLACIGIDVVAMRFLVVMSLIGVLSVTENTARLTESGRVQEPATWGSATPCVQSSGAILRQVGGHGGSGEGILIEIEQRLCGFPGCSLV